MASTITVSAAERAEKLRSESAGAFGKVPLVARLFHGIVAYNLRDRSDALSSANIFDRILAVEKGVNACWSDCPVGKMGIISAVEVNRAFTCDIWSQVDKNTGKRFIGENGDSFAELPIKWIVDNFGEEIALGEQEMTEVISHQAVTKNPYAPYAEIWGKSISICAVWYSRRASHKCKSFARAFAKARGIKCIRVENYESFSDAIDCAFLPKEKPLTQSLPI